MDEDYMRHALQLAAQGRGRTAPNPMVGAVIVNNGRIIGKGYHERCGEAHAEVNAFRNATEDVEGACMYVTLEPCSHEGRTPPCADRIIAEKISRVVIGATDPNPLVSGTGIARLRSAGIDVVTGVLADESTLLNEVFMKYILEKEPFVTLKLAMSLDGKIATSTGESQWISCEASRYRVHELRDMSTGILVGVGTVLADDPQLTCRIPGGANPVRIVADSALRTPEDARILHTLDETPTIIATTQRADARKVDRIRERGAQVIVFDDPDGRVPLKALMRQLGSQGIDSILAEGGSTLAASLLAEECVDKVHWFIAPMLIGGEDAKTPLGGRGIERLADAVRLTRMTTDSVGEDILLTGYIERG
ncbi:MAG: bifunctional diaminohydroxyphosphoribosylaminopyrimidine deaminase/5-amino-6-(5-phosphoribosylamino)uracil reductase RibD [Actinobacteria bacterium]|nr:bifunctional diaminohydroxyphosphoribosylaminopyrimidine deaminase/5-amino-6-(5-phosphoribosylamino)uracil reductase RibD [Actinomycetota bacterium]